MKINNLTESTIASMPNQAGAQAPTFGRDPNMLETTTASAISSVATPIAGMQRRSKGSMLKGIKSSKKFPNSVEEGAMPPSVIKAKEKIRLMSDADKKEYFKGKSKEQLQNMARSHGYGQGSNVYAKYVTEGVLDDTRARMAASRNPAARPAATTTQPVSQPAAAGTDYTPKVGDSVLWRHSDPRSKMMPMLGTVVAVAPGKVTLEIHSRRMIQDLGKNTIDLDLNQYTVQPSGMVAMGADKPVATAEALDRLPRPDNWKPPVPNSRPRPAPQKQMEVGDIIGFTPQTHDYKSSGKVFKAEVLRMGPGRSEVQLKLLNPEDIAANGGRDTMKISFWGAKIQNPYVEKAQPAAGRVAPMGSEEVTEAKGLHKKVKIVKGPDAGKIGWIRQIKLGLFKGAPKKYDVDIEGGGQANGLPGTALRLIKGEQDLAEGQPADNDIGTTAGGTKMTLGQWKQMWMKKMPKADFATLFRSPPSMPGSAIAYFDGWMNNPDARWDPKQGVAEDRGQNQQWSNKDMEKLRVATKDFDDVFASDDRGRKINQDATKQRLKTRPMAGPKGVLPEQGVTGGVMAPASIDKPIHEIEYSVKGPQSAVKRKIKVKAASHDSAINALKNKLGNGVVIHTISTLQNMTEGKPANLNDDDWYEINPSTNTIVRQTGPSSYRLPFGSREIKLPNGNVVMRGMRAKYIDGLKGEMSEAAGDEWEEETGKFQRFVEYAKKALMRERDPKRRIESANYLSKQENKFFGSPVSEPTEDTPFGSIRTGKAFTDLIKGIMDDIQGGRLHHEQQALAAAIWLEPEGKQFLKTAHDDFIKMIDHSRKEREQHAIALSGYQVTHFGGRVVGSVLKGGISNDPAAAMTPEIYGVLEMAEQEILRKKGEREDEAERQRDIAIWNALPMPLKIAAAAAVGKTPAQLEKILLAKNEIEAVGGLDVSDFPNLPQQAAADDEFAEPEKVKK